jgi:hypothetical protein
MSYHDYKKHTAHWSADNKEVEEEPGCKLPRIQIISPQKKLYDIQQVLSRLPEKAMTVVELSDQIQSILDGEV